ncbi:MAG: helix-turn-helix domain-containing protein [Candidatus Diapherotrites archaeon]|uniref:Helix-turn-helix domain-containing protein n=1 Tax=Candidatus Iainarchaeum sp. TaxID=3101447 RepID=A0A7J4ISY4_9ARCH|nr:MAG: ArsR family transcriptional regulator [archaeon GW2011_AR10]MBS3059430.1 helix-turn-helix domain-containing protein [Candidatus Diapherotrites archaeon]HIH07854.1 helix-turn-helix domain-containing protein [Candidatus Diapherotrites archaeon]
MDLFKALGNQNRRSILKLLLRKEFHVSGLAKELNISVPVCLKHIRVLEGVGLVERTAIGNSHMIQLRKEALKNLDSLWPLFEKSLVLEVSEGTSMLDALKKISSLKFKKTPTGYFITSVDGKEGVYTFEVDGELPKYSADKFKIKKDIEVELKRLVPVVGKKIQIKVS